MKTSKIMIATILVAVLFAIVACQNNSAPAGNETGDEPLYNESLNNELEALASPEPAQANFSLITIERRPDAMYEIALDDVFTLTNGNVNSSQISVLGVMLGDSYSDVLAKRGIPDVTFIAADKSYKNMEYSKKIGIFSNQTAVTYHVENETVTRISIRKSFKPYTHGNTTFGVEKEYIYATFDLPDYTDFTSFQRVLHYREKGIEIYLYRDKIDVISLVYPKEFKGVNYVNELEWLSDFIVVNVTKAIPIE